jgi:hypothetical protein
VNEADDDYLQEMYQQELTDKANLKAAEEIIGIGSML